jgi:hypothetical protein
MNKPRIKRTILGAILVFVIQAICLGGQILARPPWLAVVFGIGSELIPFVGYLVLLYPTSVFQKLPSAIRTVGLSVLSIFATISGQVVITIIIIQILRAAGFPLRD